MRKVKIGVCEFSFPVQGPLAVQMAKEAGFEGMQITDGLSFRGGYPFLNPRIQDAYLNAGEANGIVFQAMHLQTLFTSQFMKEKPSSEKGKVARECVENAARACKAMGIPAIMVTVIRIENREQYAYAVENLKYTLDICDRYGIRLTMENDLSAEAFLKLRDEVGQGMRLCFDTMNTVVNGIGWPEDVLSQVGISSVDHFHMKDCVENENGFMTKYTTPFRLIGEGRTHIEEAAARIKELDYSGWIVSESFYHDPVFGGADCVELAQRDVKTLQKLFSLSSGT